MNDVSRKIRELLLELSAEERINVLQHMGICLNCGDDLMDELVGTKPCWCTQDE